MQGLVLPPGAFRLVLAFVVLISHMSSLDVGRLAVLLFFYLSGYWTVRIWSEKFDRRSVGRFYVARYWRIAPLFLIATFAAAAARGAELQWQNFTLLGLASTEGVDPTHVSWSLDIELQFYLLVPLVAAIMASVRRDLIFAGAVLICAAGVWLEVVLGLTTVAKYLPAFILGAATFTYDWRPSEREANISLLVFLAVTAATVFTPFFDKGTPDPFDRDLFGLLWMLPLLPYAARSLTVRSGPLDRDVGSFSYAFYLIHPLVIFGSDLLVGGLGGKLVAMVMSFPAAAALFYAFDKPMEALRNRVTSGGGMAVRPSGAGP